MSDKKQQPIEIVKGSASPTAPTENKNEGAYITNGDNTTLQNNVTAPSDSKFIQYQRSKLHEVVNEKWGVTWIDNDIYGHLIKYANPQSAKANKNGFSFKSLDGKKIEWNSATQEGPEKIGTSKKITEESAASIVAMSRARGWKTLNIHGKVKDKELLWLATQRQNLHDKEDFKKRQEAGHIPADEKYQDLTVSNFTPLLDSKIMQQWQRELAAYNAANPQAEKAPSTEVKKNQPSEEIKDLASNMNREHLPELPDNSTKGLQILREGNSLKRNPLVTMTPDQFKRAQEKAEKLEKERNRKKGLTAPKRQIGLPAPTPTSNKP